MENIDEKIEYHIFVKYGSDMIDEKLGHIKKMFDLEYLHKHNGSKPKSENKNDHYNKNMKIKPCTIYKFRGSEKSFNKLMSSYKNLERITDKN